MATRFEIVLHGDDPARLRAAGEAALDEIDRLEAQLSLYRPASDIARLNAAAAQRPVRVEPELFQLLQRARDLSKESNGAFDMTVAPLVRAWGFMGGSGRQPTPEELAAARSVVGMHLVDLNETGRAVRFTRPGVMLDLGAIGKGYALERAAEVLEEAGVRAALLHGGTSTIRALGAPPGLNGWTIALPNPSTAAFGSGENPPSCDAAPLATIQLRNEALSVSAVWGRGFHHDGEWLGHVLDPRTGRPARTALLSAVAIPSATDSDALSTALLILGRDFQRHLRSFRPGARSLLVEAGTDGQTGEVYSEGFCPQTVG